MVIRSTAPCNTQEAIPQAAMTAQGPEALFLQFCDLYNAEGNRYPGLGHLLNESQVNVGVEPRGRPTTCTRQPVQSGVRTSSTDAVYCRGSQWVAPLCIPHA